MSKNYHVCWEVDVFATSPKDAAEQARELQVKRDSPAVTFSVMDESGNMTVVDLNADEFPEGIAYG